MGERRFKEFFKVIMKKILKGIMEGEVMGFEKEMGEFGDKIKFV